MARLKQTKSKSNNSHKQIANRIKIKGAQKEQTCMKKMKTQK